MLPAAHTDAESTVAVQGDGGVSEDAQHQPDGGGLAGVRGLVAGVASVGVASVAAAAVDAQQAGLLVVGAALAGHHHQVPRATRVGALQLHRHLEGLLGAQQVEHGLQVLLDVAPARPVRAREALMGRQHQGGPLAGEVALGQASAIVASVGVVLGRAGPAARQSAVRG